MKPENTVISFPGTDATFGGPGLAIIAGPCAIESRAQAFAVAERVHRAGAQFFRGGAYKPRTSPYSFQGLEKEALKIMADIRDQHGMKIVTEAIDHESLELVEEYADVIQIGARNMQNFSLLKRAGRSRKPVLLKRGIPATAPASATKSLRYRAQRLPWAPTVSSSKCIVTRIKLCRMECSRFTPTSLTN